MPMLKYIGPTTYDGSPPPLPQGWPAADHEEEDPELLEQKLAFRVKRGRVDEQGMSHFVAGEAAYEIDNPSKPAGGKAKE